MESSIEDMTEFILTLSNTAVMSITNTTYNMRTLKNPTKLYSPVDLTYSKRRGKVQ